MPEKKAAEKKAVEKKAVEKKAVEKKVEKRGRGRPKGSKDSKPRVRTKGITAWDGNEHMEPGDRGYFLKAAMESWSLPPIDTSDPVQVEERIIMYFERCVRYDLKPTVMGLCNTLGIDRYTFYRWGQGELRADTHGDSTKKAYQMMAELWETYMMEGKVNPIVGIFLGKNHFGFADKQELVVEPRQTVVDSAGMEDVHKLYIEDKNTRKFP